MNSNTKLIVSGVIGLLLVITTYSLQDKKAPVEEMVLDTSEEKVIDMTKQRDSDTPTAFESGVEIGTDGTVLTVDTSGVAADNPALITFRTDGNSVHLIAVPSMGIQLCAATKSIADVSTITPGDRVSVRGKTDGEGRVVPCESDTHQLVVKGLYAAESVGFTFMYPKSPKGYLIQTEERQVSGDPMLVTSILLMSEVGAEEILLSDVPREFPPVIRLRVYNNPEGHSPLEWTKENTIESNYALAMAEPVEIIVGREKAVGYTTDGLYLTDTYVVGYGDRILVISGEYINPEDAIFADLEQLVDSVSFIRR